MSLNRRTFGKGAASGLLAFLIGGKTVLLSPAEAREKEIPFQTLSPREVELISLIGEAIVPGSTGMGLAHYLDHQLSGDPEQSTLIIRYLGVNPPHTGFYRSALAALDKSALATFGKDLAGLSDQELEKFISQLSRENPKGWDNAPPAPFFYFVLRSDAIDVTYGTKAGFDRLDIPYLAHIEPGTRSWT
ncbi:gluconate 2-dehydrogenase subunit 3 family protein [Emcibacter sp.]|uniref:gluconate 2-dehydrogenase subunit 3 family protein n=1 Tax=Emcibacter sp. TaxID=1979954 RepID=UPI003A8DC0CD